MMRAVHPVPERRATILNFVRAATGLESKNTYADGSADIFSYNTQASAFPGSSYRRNRRMFRLQNSTGL